MSEDQIRIDDSAMNYPMIPLRDIVIFPHMIVPLFIGRSKSIKALEESMMDDRRIVVTAQRQPNIEEPEAKDLYTVGTLCEVLNMIKLPDGTIKVLLEGTNRATVLDYLVTDEYFAVKVRKEEEDDRKDLEIEALMRDVLAKFDKYVRYSKALPPESYTSASSVEEPCRFADLVASQLVLKVDMKQRILEAFTPRDRLIKLSELFDEELEILDIQKRIQGQVKKQIEQTQKEYYLKEQMKAIQKELGESNEKSDEIEDIRDRMSKVPLPDHAREKIESELKRLGKMPFGTAEAVVVRNYIEWLLDIPWGPGTPDNLDVSNVRRVLDEDHHGLEKVKERIVEYLAVRRLNEKGKGVILCLVGPPGTGKTSLGRSIARALGKKYIRASLGGVRDEAEIRGHRKTYIGSMPGRIVQQMKRAGTTNPLFLLDEVDKMSVDFRGDPAAALLEVLDPEINMEFVDHYLEIPYDLSNVMFITTANLVQPIPAPLLDRMEIIQLNSYTEQEKFSIARQYLLKKQLGMHGLPPNAITLTDDALREIIRRYTRESGVRNLEREIATVCRKYAHRIVEKMGDVLEAQNAKEAELKEKAAAAAKKKSKKKAAAKPEEAAAAPDRNTWIPGTEVTKENLSDYLGHPKYRYGRIGEKNEIGVATGMAWTQTGGEILNIEATLMPGKGSLILTGLLGDVMKESAQAALSYSRSHAPEYGLTSDYFQKHDIHLHVPEGAIPKDGPSAGVALTSAMVSALTRRPVNRNVAMTGEITLRGRVLPVGGVKEKVLAAHRAGINTVLIPAENEKDFLEIAEAVRSQMTVVLIERLEEVLDYALLECSEAKSTKSRSANTGGKGSGKGRKAGEP